MQLQIDELETYCDDPRFTTELRPVLQANAKNGFALVIFDGKFLRKVVEKNGKPYRYRTIEAALDELADVPNLSSHVVIDASQWTNS
jgi:hypothetical protein